MSGNLDGPQQHEQHAERDVLDDLQRQPHLFVRLAENTLAVAESLRDNYFANTAHFVADLRRAIQQAAQGRRPDPILAVHSVERAGWDTMQHEVVTFVDGGVGRVRLSGQMPILLRVGSYSVRVGERRLAERERFGYYPVILGDLEGGSKERRDFVDVVRITAELLGGLSALERTPDLRVLMVHGPLVYTMWHYMGHAPFAERDVDLLLSHYAPDPSLGRALKDEFLREARLDVYPQMTGRSDQWIERRLFEPLAFIAYLLRRLMHVARTRTPVPIVAGVVERSDLREFSERVLLRRVFRNLRDRNHASYFNQMYGRTDLTSEKALLDRLGYDDTLLLGMLLEPGQFSEPWVMSKEYAGLRRADVSLPGESAQEPVDYAVLARGHAGFPRVRGCYVHVSEKTEPLRIEVFDALGDDQIAEAARRAYLYARLLPGYGFPVGLDVVDKHARVPTWLTDAYTKLITYHLGVSLQRGEIGDAEMRRILVQAIYMTHRDWLFRPPD